MASISKLAAGLGKLLLSLLWVTGPVAIGAGRWTSPVSIETHVGREDSVFQATANVNRVCTGNVCTGKKFMLRLELRGPQQRSADESE
jgi:hypothetical protein